MLIPTRRLRAVTTAALIALGSIHAEPADEPAVSEDAAVTADATSDVKAAATPDAKADAKANAKRPEKAKAVALDSNLFAGMQTERIPLGRAIKMALQNNLEAKFERVGINVEGAKVRFAAGAFDPVFTMQAQHQSVRRLEDINSPRSADIIRQQEALQLQQVGILQQEQILALQQQQFVQNFNRVQAALQQQVQETNFQLGAIGQNPIALQNIELPQTLQNPGNFSFQTPQVVRQVELIQRVDQAVISLQGRTALGTRYSFEVSATHSRNTFVGDPEPVVPLYESFAGLTISQPLLKNFGPDANLADVRAARLNKRIQVLNWKQSVASAVQGVMAAYFDMLAAWEDMRVREDAIAADTKLVELYHRRLEVGFASPIDVQQAEVAVSTDREALLGSKNAFLERQYAFRRLILDKFDPQDARVFVPESAPSLTIPTLNRSALLSAAYEGRYDYQATLLNAEVQNVRLRFAKNQLLPQLDLVGTYGLNGLDTNFGGSFSRSFKGDTPTWSIGVNFQVPLGNVQPRAQYDAIRGQREQAVLRIKQSEVTVGNDVEQVMSRIETNRQRVETSRKTRELGEEAVRIALRRVEEGLMSAFDVIEQQRRLYEAKSREIASWAELNKSITQLWLVTGTVLEKQGIHFQEPVENVRHTTVTTTTTATTTTAAVPARKR